MMSEESEKVQQRCASCGVKEGDGDVKLKNCTACYLVQYCGVNCQKQHRKKHKRDCKKRAAELRDEILFRQPESNHNGDCPICFLPLSIDEKKSMMMACCSKMVCSGCVYANMEREKQEKLAHKCAFCRQPVAESDVDVGKQLKDRVKMNDPFAMRKMGVNYRDDGDRQSAFEYFSKAAELGDALSQYELGIWYQTGHYVEKDELKMVYHWEQAAIGGHPSARYNLGVKEIRNGRFERGIKHYIIAAKLGHDKSLDELKEGYKDGFVSKHDLTEALRGHQAAVDAIKCPLRDEAESRRKSR